MINNERKINLVDISKIIGRNNENDIVDEMLRSKFFNWLKERGFSHERLDCLFDSRRIPSVEQSSFNVAIRKAHDELNINIIDQIVFLEECFVKFKKILSVLDDESRYLLKITLSEKYKIEIDRTNLEDLLC